MSSQGNHCAYRLMYDLLPAGTSAEPSDTKRRHLRVGLKYLIHYFYHLFTRGLFRYLSAAGLAMMSAAILSLYNLYHVITE